MVGALDFGLRGMGQAIVLCSWATQYPSPPRSIMGVSELSGKPDEMLEVVV